MTDKPHPAAVTCCQIADKHLAGAPKAARCALANDIAMAMCEHAVELAELIIAEAAREADKATKQ